MADRAGSGWRPLPKESIRPLLRTPFARLAVLHGAMAAGDALLALALAGSLFFSISPEAARPKVGLYLLLTMVPFSVLVPLIGPWVDSRAGGRRSMILLTGVLRALLCVVMADDLAKVLFFPEALMVLVLGRSYSVARASLVPSLVDDDTELVRANSRLVLVASIGGAMAVVPGLAVLSVSTPAVLWMASVAYAIGGLLALRLPATVVASDAPDAAETTELHSAGILLSASAMAVLRASVGFVTFLLAFLLRADDAPTWWFGVVASAGVVGGLSGAVLAPSLRRRLHEERILLVSTVAVTTLAAVLLIGQAPLRVAAPVLAFGIGGAASAAKVAFDSIVQRDAPDANTGRSFARFETRFQLAWVAGSFAPVLVDIPLGAGLALVAVGSALSAVGYATGRQVWRWRWSNRPTRRSVVEVDPGQPEAGSVDLGRGGQDPG